MYGCLEVGPNGRCLGHESGSLIMSWCYPWSSELLLSQDWFSPLGIDAFPRQQVIMQQVSSSCLTLLTQVCFPFDLLCHIIRQDKSPCQKPSTIPGTSQSAELWVSKPLFSKKYTVSFILLQDYRTKILGL